MEQKLRETCWRVLRKEERLPGYVLTSQDVHALEKRAIFQKIWICVGAPHLDVAAGGAKPFRFLDQSYIITRNEGGVLRVFHNVCRHRGAEVLCKDKKGGALSCPYHGWTYGLDGACIATPHIAGEGLHEDPRLDKNELGLFSVRHQVWANLLFVCLDDETPDFNACIAPIMRRCGEEAAMDELRIDPALTVSFELNGNWKLTTENFVDAYHVRFIHRALQQVNAMADHRQLLGGSCYAGQYGNDYRADYLKMNWTASPITNSAIRAGEYNAFFICPNLIFTVFQDHAFSIVFEPTHAALTKEWAHFHFAGEDGLAEEGRDSRRAFAEFLTMVNVEDIEIVESMQRTRVSVAFDGGRFAPAHDNAAEHFQRLYAWRMLHGLGEPSLRLEALPFAEIADASKAL